MVHFIKYRWMFFLLSGLLLLIGFWSIFTHSFVYSIDFTGGGLVEFTLSQKQKYSQIKKVVDEKYPSVAAQQTSQGFIVRGKNLTTKSTEQLSTDLSKYGAKKSRFEVVGPSVSGDNIRKTIIASIIATVGILAYLTFTFKSLNFALAAIVALIHDMCILLGAWSILGWLFGVEFDVLFITSLLTTMSFSVHDTIVIFDKMKEEEEHGHRQSLEANIDVALSRTMIRSLNNSFTIILMLTALVIMGGESIRWFALSLLIGTITGTYSSPFIATPFYFLLATKIKR